MLPIGRQPVIHHVYEEVTRAGVDSVLIVTGRDKRAMEDHFDGEDGSNGPGGPRIFYVRQSAPRGLGDAILMGECYAGDGPFFVAMGDTIMGPSRSGDLLPRMSDAYFEFEADLAIAVQPVLPEATRRYGIVAPVPDSDTARPFLIQDIVEKPGPNQAPSALAVSARYILSPRIFDCLARTPLSATGELEITDAIRLCVHEGGRVCCVPLGEGQQRYDVGNFESYYKTFITFALRDDEYGDVVRRHFGIGPE
jgi:UTP--glucose-1-phosphate uridylyltransferase